MEVCAAFAAFEAFSNIREATDTAFEEAANASNEDSSASLKLSKDCSGSNDEVVVVEIGGEVTVVGKDMTAEVVTMDLILTTIEEVLDTTLVDDDITASGIGTTVSI